ncbi:MAG: proton-conducting transporter membrane subunit, partial [Desulfitobacterium hafniense]|nr:proton-conducting transporter membrane subunit [Desulfitobacterium hafniense]
MTTQGGQTIRRICTGFTGITAVLILLVYGRSILSSSNVVKFIPFKGQLLNKGALFPLSWQVDGLGAFFIFVLLLGQTLASFYAWGYLKEYQGRKSLNLFSFFWILFLISMYGVVIAGDGFTFLLMWELMSLFSFFLVLYEHEESHNRRAAFIYLVMTHVGTVFLTSAILFIYSKTGTFSFEAWTTIKSLVPAWQLNLLYLCFFLGLGTKAGMVPLHIWLPYAHSAAPTPVSALMSGVMVKIALYVFLRIIWVSIGISAAWWGWLLLVIGAASALIGILFASVEGDIKRTLAYSTVENVGILTMAMGLAFVAKYYEMNSIAILALAAFCWHLLQHLLFKSVMFMGAGNVIQATHTRRLELMGGLLKRLPKTGKWVLISAAGLAALPPLGGFWGEWLLFNSLWQGAREMSDGWSRVVLPLCVSLLGIVGAVAVAT